MMQAKIVGGVTTDASKGSTAGSLAGLFEGRSIEGNPREFSDGLNLFASELIELETTHAAFTLYVEAWVERVSSSVGESRYVSEIVEAVKIELNRIDEKQVRDYILKRLPTSIGKAIAARIVSRRYTEDWLFDEINRYFRQLREYKEAEFIIEVFWSEIEKRSPKLYDRCKGLNFRLIPN